MIKKLFNLNRNGTINGSIYGGLGYFIATLYIQAGQAPLVFLKPIVFTMKFISPDKLSTILSFLTAETSIYAGAIISAIIWATIGALIQSMLGLSGGKGK